MVRITAVQASNSMRLEVRYLYNFCKGGEKDKRDESSP